MKPIVSFLSVRLNKSITCQSCYAVHAYSHGRINKNVNWVCRPLMSAVTGQTQPGLVELEIECYLVSHSVDCQRWRGTSRDDAVHSQVIRLQAVWSRCLEENKKGQVQPTRMEMSDLKLLWFPFKGVWYYSGARNLKAYAANVYQQQKSNTFYLGQNWRHSGKKMSKREERLPVLCLLLLG